MPPGEDMPCYVYIIRCTSSSGKISYYTGYTSNILRRFKEHRSGKGARYLRGKHDLFVVHFEIHGDVASAMRREREIKNNRKLKDSLVKIF